MVGHSSGGPYVLAYTARYGADVAGIVLVDASHPEQVARFREVTPVTLQQSLRPFKVAAALNWTGLVRFMATSAPGEAHEQREVTSAKAAYASTSLAAMLNEANGLDSTFAEEAGSHQLGDRPVIVLTAGAPASQDELRAMQMTQAQGRGRRRSGMPYRPMRRPGRRMAGTRSSPTPGTRSSSTARMW
jgi:pimeloyl-ACP methyl ester carboxylesterase